ncbi:ROK family protein [Sphingomonas sp. RHCKR47]|uniref:ROK family protein n=1 Tax=Sphingomonas citricola TaxID=2862498 RepID=UPI001CA535F4|nr:ROK family protein [Sphingomonas citricola]MBW6523868.1 ROK family protein [Sphingomonas citricola]
MSDTPLVAALELGGTKCVAMLASGPGAIHDEVRVPTTRPEETLAALEAVLDGWRGFAAIGIASFGPISIDRQSRDYGEITSTPKPGWASTDVARRFAARYDVPVGFHTDVVGAALGEARWGAGQGLDALAYVTVGTGIGAGLIARGQPVDGLTHAELGHIRVPRLSDDDWGGVCPYHGACVEGLASGPAIAARTGLKGEDIPADHPVWDSVVGALATLMGTLTLTGVPRRIVLGGGVLVGNSHLLPRLRAATRSTLNGYVARPELEDMDTFLVPAALGANAGPMGAVVLGQQALAERSALPFTRV